MNIQKWIKTNFIGIMIGIIICFILFPKIWVTGKILVGGLIGGYIYSLIPSTRSRGRNYGIGPLVVPLISLGAAALVFFGSVFQKPQSTLSQQLAEIPIWIWFVAGFFLLLMIKALRKKPRTIIIQEQR